MAYYWKLFIIYFICIYFISCNYFTEPEPYINVDTQPTTGGVKLRDHLTGQICLDGMQIKNGKPTFDIVPDSSTNILFVVGIEFDSVALHLQNSYTINSIKYSEWQNWNVPVLIYIVNNEVKFITNFGGWKNGLHTVQFTLLMFNPKSGLGIITPEKRIVSIQLMFM